MHVPESFASVFNRLSPSFPYTFLHALYSFACSHVSDAYL